MNSQKGSAAVEMAIVTPIILLIFLGVAQFGWLLVNFVAVGDAASAGARFFAAQRGTTTPYSATQTQVQNAGAFLSSSGLSISTAVNGVTCSDDTGCAADLASASSPATVVTATVNVTYKNFQPVFTGSFFNLKTMMPSTLTASVSERVQ